MADIADAEGVRVVVMKDFLRYTTSGPLAGFLAWLFAKYPAVRDRALADPWFLYKLAVEVLGDVGLAVAGEATSRNDASALDEAEFFLSDVVSSVFLNGAVLTMLSPAVTLGKTPGGRKALIVKSRIGGRLNHFMRLVFMAQPPGKMPASIFAKAGHRVIPYAWKWRGLALLAQGVRIAAVSGAIGFVGQGTSNAVCALRRKYWSGSYSKAYAETVRPESPPLLEPAVEWALFTGTDANWRQQAIIGVERVIEGAASGGGKVSSIVARASSAAIRIANNAWGGERFASRMRRMEDEVARRHGESP
uniref:Uncharacterized protein n=1 Tax=Micromonas pusilla TaxID=38833 RepID=A0A7R9TH19_MICPS